MKTLWCKNQENPSDRISHAWAPLKNLSLGEQIQAAVDVRQGGKRQAEPTLSYLSCDELNRAKLS
jgi:hypothetical protein